MVRGFQVVLAAAVLGISAFANLPVGFREFTFNGHTYRSLQTSEVNGFWQLHGTSTGIPADIATIVLPQEVSDLLEQLSHERFWAKFPRPLDGVVEVSAPGTLDSLSLNVERAFPTHPAERTKWFATRLSVLGSVLLSRPNSHAPKGIEKISSDLRTIFDYDRGGFFNQALPFDPVGVVMENGLFALGEERFAQMRVLTLSDGEFYIAPADAPSVTKVFHVSQGLLRRFRAVNEDAEVPIEAARSFRRRFVTETAQIFEQLERFTQPRIVALPDEMTETFNDVSQAFRFGEDGACGQRVLTFRNASPSLN